MGHFSKYGVPGAVGIFSSNSDGLVGAAFLNSDGSKALVVYNDSTFVQPFQVQWGSQSFAYTLPSLAGATFTRARRVADTTSVLGFKSKPPVSARPADRISPETTPHSACRPKIPPTWMAAMT